MENILWSSTWTAIRSIQEKTGHTHLHMHMHMQELQPEIQAKNRTVQSRMNGKELGVSIKMDDIAKLISDKEEILYINRLSIFRFYSDMKADLQNQ